MTVMIDLLMQPVIAVAVWFLSRPMFTLGLFTWVMLAPLAAVLLHFATRWRERRELARARKGWTFYLAGLKD